MPQFGGFPYMRRERERLDENKLLKVQLPKDLAIELYDQLANELKKYGYHFIKEELLTKEINKEIKEGLITRVINKETHEFLEYTFRFSNLH